MTTIYASTACIRTSCVETSIQRLLNLGFSNIELSGGIKPIPNLLNRLKFYQEQGCTFLCHNYFPPPHQDLVLNLASLHDTTYQRSIALAKQAIAYSHELEGCAYGVHAGFLLDLQATELGKTIEIREIENRQIAYQRFIETFVDLSIFAQNNGVRLYVENNVYSSDNYNRYGTDIPFLACTSQAYLDLKHSIEALGSGVHCGKESLSLECPLLLDLAHLKVSCHSLGLDFEQEFRKLALFSDYWHISENDGMCDSNQALTKDSMLLEVIKKIDLRPRLITLEIYDEDNLVESYNHLLNALL